MGITIIQFASRKLVIDYSLVVVVSMLICEYFTVLRLEIELIWLSKWTYTKILFLLIRYSSFVSMFLMINDQLFLNLTPEECKVSFSIGIWSLALQTCIAEAIFAVRTWAIWRGNRILGIGLGTLTVANIVAQCVISGLFTNEITYRPAPYHGFRGCNLWSQSRIGQAYAFAFTIVEAVILILTAISAIQLYKRRSKSELLQVIHRDAIIFYVYTLWLTCMFFIPFWSIMWTRMAFTAYTALSARLILNIRGVGRRGVETELHDGSAVFTTIVQFTPVNRPHEFQMGGDPSGLDYPNCDRSLVS